MWDGRADALVFVGATGDLACRKIIRDFECVHRTARGRGGHYLSQSDGRCRVSHARASRYRLWERR
jgi:hypothetical protein